MEVPQPLPTGAELRLTGPSGPDTVLCLGGGSAAELPGTWSPGIEWLVRRLARRLPGLRFAELRYRTKNWYRFDSCVADARAALDALVAEGATRVCLVGFSLGGGVAAAIAGDAHVVQMVGLAPWFPPPVGLGGLRGRRVRILHGTLDGVLPGVPGVRPGHSAQAAGHMRALGIDVRRTLLRGAVHGLAARPLGVLVPLPRARAWSAGVQAEIAHFAAPRTAGATA